MIQAIDIYYRLREEVDSQVAVLEKLHKDWMACRKGCCSCCLNLSVWPVEFYAILEQMKAAKWPKPQFNEGKECGFLDREDGCQIYPFRPIICRTHGLPLAYWQDDSHPPGYGIIFCDQNFDAAGDIGFDANNTLNMDQVNEKLARINIVFLEENPDLNLAPADRIELRELLTCLEV
ncbi:MAG: YkgJ family cysteine cluster protein [Phycisphaerae bacterium]|nr:YkgJ family cysteine cluster protein [Phycisphaerae bacterium]